MPIGRARFGQMKSLLLGLPGWDHGGTRRAFLHDLDWGHALLNQALLRVDPDAFAAFLGRVDAPARPNERLRTTMGATPPGTIRDPECP